MKKRIYATNIFNKDIKAKMSKPPTREDVILDRKERELLSVSDLIKILSAVEDSDHVYIGEHGHFGDFRPVYKHDIRETTAYITSTDTWRRGKQRTLRILKIDWPNIGSDPD